MFKASIPDKAQSKCSVMLDCNRADFYYKKVSLKLIEEEIQCQPKYCWCFSHPFVDDDWYIASSAALGRASIAVEI